LLQLAPRHGFTNAMAASLLGAHPVTLPLGQAGRLEQRFLRPPPSFIQSDFKF
jgi:hypothetical protein